jgi:DNA-binding transcriptional ArsR family regulator
MDNKTKDALKQLQAEIRQLQTIVAVKQGSVKEEISPADENAGARRVKDAVVHYTVSHAVPGEGPEPKKMTAAANMAQLTSVTSEAAAALGYALASPQKIALLRALLDRPSESASVLGDITGLSTGSLYHHLRELMRAGLIHQAGRNIYVLTERGTRVLLVLLTLASE